MISRKFDIDKIAMIKELGDVDMPFGKRLF